MSRFGAQGLVQGGSQARDHALRARAGTRALPSPPYAIGAEASFRELDVVRFMVQLGFGMESCRSWIVASRASSIICVTARIDPKFDIPTDNLLTSIRCSRYLTWVMLLSRIYQHQVLIALG